MSGYPVERDVPVGMFRLCRRDRILSTNEVIKGAIHAGMAEGFAVRANAQTGGYGRRGGGWVSEPGGLYLSVLLRPDLNPELSTLPLLISLAVNRALALFFPSSTEAVRCMGIKWPNDIVVVPEKEEHDGVEAYFRKLCGISVEVLEGAVCVGIGVNVLRPAGAAAQGPFLDLPSAKNIPAYLENLPVDLPEDDEDAIAAVCESVLLSLTDLYPSWVDEGFSPFMDEYNDRCVLRGKRITVSGDDSREHVVSGVTEGVDVSGRLLLMEPGRSVPRALHSGTVRLE